jgi:hypothetical protein
LLLPIKHRPALFHAEDPAGVAVLSQHCDLLSICSCPTSICISFLKILSRHRPRPTSIISEKATLSKPKHLPKSILHLEYQMHMQSIFSEFGKTGINVNLGIYYSHNNYLAEGLMLDVRLQTFVLFKF